MNNDLHADCAVGFFLTWLVCTIIFTKKIANIRAKEPSIISTISFYSKVACCFAMGAVFLYVVLEYLKEKTEPSYNMSFALPVIEWGITFSIAVWIFTFSFEWSDFYLNLDGPKISLVSYDVFVNKYIEYASHPEEIN